MWSSIVARLKELIQSMIGNRIIQNELHVTYAISPKMEMAIQKWTKLYLNEAEWLHEPDEQDPTRIVSLGLPSMIASEKARMALLEFDSEITAPMQEVEVDNPDYPGESQYAIDTDGQRVLIPKAEPPKTIVKQVPIGDTSRADYLESQYKKLKKQLRRQIEYGIAKGGLVIKPYIVVNGNIENEGTEDTDSNITQTIDIEFDFIQADAFYPLTFDVSGKITEAAFLQSKVERDYIYKRLEYHKWENNTVIVTNKVYRSVNNGINIIDSLGEEISLQEVPEWKDLEERTVIKNVTKPLFAYFKMPDANTIDPTSPLGVSGFSRAVSLIKDADIQYSRLLWEYEAGEMAIDIDRDAMRDIETPDGNFRTLPNHLQNRLYRKLDLGSSGDTYYPFAPALRDNHYIDGLNTILMRIEDTCGLSRGSLSDSADVARTATELKILKQRSYQTNAEIQQAIEEALKDTIYIMNVYSTLYEITPDGEYEVNFEWDDSIIVDIDSEIEKRIMLMQNGLISKLENRMWYFGETEQQATEALSKIDEETQKAETSDMVRQYELDSWNAKTEEKQEKKDPASKQSEKSGVNAK